MTNLSTRLALAALLTLASVASVEAQLASGTWTGTMSPPGGQPIPVTFEVSGAGSELSVEMSAPMIPDAIPFNDIRIDGPSMTFWWEPGIRVDCTLTRDAGGGYAGSCSDGGDRGAGALTMVPPA